MYSRISAIPLFNYKQIRIYTLYARRNVMHNKLWMRHIDVYVYLFSGFIKLPDPVSDHFNRSHVKNLPPA